jgi:hypothetical protein
MTDDVVKKTKRKPTGAAALGAGPGRPKGVSNKLTRTIRESIEAAFQGVGGPEYLMRQAEENPQAFMTLLGKIIPAQVQADVTSKGQSLGDMQAAVLAALAKKHSD